MSFLKDLKLIVMIRGVFQASEQRRQNQILWDSCENGNVNAVQKALEKGADINQMRYVGNYYPKFAYRDEMYQTFITPIIVTAVGASDNRNKESYLQILSLLMQRPDINLDRVVKDVEWEYKDSYDSFKSLKHVLTDPERGHKFRQRKCSSAHLYPISDEVAALLTTLVKKREAERHLTQMRQSEGRA